MAQSTRRISKTSRRSNRLNPHEHPHYPDRSDIAAVDGIGGRRLWLSSKLERSLGKILLSFRALLFAVSIFQMRVMGSVSVRHHRVMRY
jgi:hypothetical protein